MINYESPREKSSNQKKSLILSSALALFKEHGYENVTIQDICRVTNTSIGSIYNFFESKDGILKALAFSIFSQEYSSFEINEETVNKPFEVIDKYVLYSLHLMDDLGLDLTRVMHNRLEYITQNADGSPNFTPRVKNLIRFIRAAQAAGSFASDIPSVQAALLVDVYLHSTAFFWIYNRGTIDIDECFKICFSRAMQAFRVTNQQGNEPDKNSELSN